MLEFIPYIVTFMILYDWSIHLVYLAGKEDYFFKRKINWWPNWDRWEKKERIRYQIFWNVYWGSAFLLMIIYIFFM